MHRIPQQYHKEAWKISAVLTLTVLLGIFAVVIRLSNRPPTLDTRPQQLVEAPVVSGGSAIVYRQRGDYQWNISAVDADGNDSLITELPLTATDIGLIDASHLVYISDEKILLRDISDQTDRVVIHTPAAQMSSLVLSADRRWIAYRQDITNGKSGVFIAKLDSFPAKSDLAKPVILDSDQSGMYIPLFFDHSGHLYVTTQSANGQYRTLNQITISELPLTIASLTDEASAKAVATAPLVKHFKGKTVCTSPPVISPVHDRIACIGPHPVQTKERGMYLIDLSTGEEKFLLPPSRDTVWHPPSGADYSYTHVVWNTDGRRLAAVAIPTLDTNYNRRVTVTIDPQEEQLTILDSSSAIPAMELLGYRGDSVISGIPQGTAIGTFVIESTDTTETIETDGAYFITTIPNFVPRQ